MTLTRKKLLIILAVVAVVFVAIIVEITLYEKNKVKRGEFIVVQNYGSYVKNLSSSEKDLIEKNLYSSVALNSSDKNKVKLIDDAVIRDSSYSQDFGNSIYKTHFIIDIKSIGQSYRVEDTYSNLSVEKSGLSDYTTLVLCVDSKDLIYGDFNCQDVTSVESGIGSVDPILKYLPITTLNYSLSIDPTSSSLHIYADILLSNVDYKIGESQAIDNYKKEIANWFSSNGLDITKYSITYRY
jgi:hypothetical protein